MTINYIMGLKSALSKGFSKVGSFLKSVGSGSAVDFVGVPLMTVGGGLRGTGKISDQLAKTLS